MHPLSIKDEGKIYTACGDGKIPFVSATDIAASAFHSLIGTKPHEESYRILGPELLTMDDVWKPSFSIIDTVQPMLTCM